MPYEPVLLANIHKPDSHTLAVYEAGGGYRGLRRALKEMSPPGRGRAGQGQRAARPRRGRLSHRPEMVVPARESSRARSTSASTPTRASRARSSTACRWSSIRTRCSKASSSVATPPGPATAYVYLRYEYPLVPAADAGGHRRVLRGRLPGQEHPGQRFLAGRLHSSRRGGLRLRRRDGPDREPGRPAGVAADQAAVSRPSKGCSASRPWSTTWRRWPASSTSSIAAWPWFRSMGTPPEPNNPRDPGSFGPKLYGLSGHVNRPGCYEAPAGHHRAGSSSTSSAAACGRAAGRRRSCPAG